MLDTLLILAAGVIVGWHVPQPVWAKPITAAVVGYAQVAWAKLKGLVGKE